MYAECAETSRRYSSLWVEGTGGDAWTAEPIVMCVSAAENPLRSLLPAASLKTTAEPATAQHKALHRGIRAITLIGHRQGLAWLRRLFLETWK